MTPDMPEEETTIVCPVCNGTAAVQYDRSGCWWICGCGWTQKIDDN